MEVNEMNKCLWKFYVSVRRKDGTFYKRNNLLSVRAKLFTDAWQWQNLIPLLRYFYNHLSIYTKTIIPLRLVNIHEYSPRLRLGEYSPIFTSLRRIIVQVLRRCFPSVVTQQCCGATMGGRWLAQSGNCMKWWKVSIQTNSVISALKEASTGCSLLQLLLIRIAVLRHSLKVVSVPKEGNKRAGSESFRVVHMPARSRKSRKSTAYRPCSKWPGWRQIFVLRWTEAITTEYIFWRTWPAPVSRQCFTISTKTKRDN